MTTTPTIRSRHSFSARFAMITTVSLGLLAGPVAMAGPATAMPEHSKQTHCWVDAKDPKKADRDHGRESFKDDPRKGHRKSVNVKFTFTINCDRDALVHFNQKMFQDHGRRDERLGSDRGSVWVSKDRDAKISNTEWVTADRGDKFVTVFHTVRIQFKDNDKSDHGSRSTDFSESNHVDIWVSNRHR